MKRIKAFGYGILAGLSIALGGTVFLSVDNKIVGAVGFTVGLFTVCTFGFNLFTGKVCYVFERGKDYALDLTFIWPGNLCGAWLTAKLPLSFTNRASEQMNMKDQPAHARSCSAPASCSCSIPEPAAAVPERLRSDGGSPCPAGAAARSPR